MNSGLNPDESPSPRTHPGAGGAFPGLEGTRSIRNTFHSLLGITLEFARSQGSQSSSQIFVPVHGHGASATHSVGSFARLQVRYGRNCPRFSPPNPPHALLDSRATIGCARLVHATLLSRASGMEQSVSFLGSFHGPSSKPRRMGVSSRFGVDSVGPFRLNRDTVQFKRNRAWLSGSETGVKPNETNRWKRRVLVVNIVDVWVGRQHRPCLNEREGCEMAGLSDMEALRAYVTAPDTTMNRADTTVLLQITHNNLKANFVDIRFDRHMLIGQVKDKVSSHTGTPVTSMKLQLKNSSGRTIAVLEDESRKLGYYSPEDGYTIHVTDLDPFSASANGWLEDTNLVEKYTLSDEAYAQRENTFLKYKEARLREDPTWTVKKDLALRRGETYVPPEQMPESYGEEIALQVHVGDRCEVSPGARRGEVRFVGKVDGLPPGYWIGIQFDEPVGKNDGSVRGKEYFSCPPSYGGFARPENVQAGDFPPIDEFEDELEEF